MAGENSFFRTVLRYMRRRAASGVRSNGLCPQSDFAAGGLVPAQLFAREASSATATRSECEREAREAAANLVLSTVLPHSVRMGTRVLETLGNMREILSCKQALPIFEELVKAGQEPVGVGASPGGVVGTPRALRP